MSEGDALNHTSKWFVDVAPPLSDEVSINPMNIQNRTIVHRLFRNREYRPMVVVASGNDSTYS